MKLVKVDWHDCTTRQNWIANEDACNLATISCTSVGWLLKKTRKEIVLTSMKADDDSSCHQTIPRGCVTRITELKEA